MQVPTSGSESHWPGFMALSHAKRSLGSVSLWAVRKPFVFAIWPVHFPLQDDLLSLIFLQSIPMQQRKITPELPEHAKQIRMLYDAKCKSGKIKQSLRRCLWIIPFSGRSKRKKRKVGRGGGGWGENAV